MTILDKMNLVKSSSASNVTRLHPVVQPPVPAMPQRQYLAENGKVLPSANREMSKTEAERKREVEDAVAHVSGYVQNISRELNFSLDEELGRTIITVVDDESGEVIRQIPSEEMLEIARVLSESATPPTRGVLFKGDA